jgi:hypothetical protein
MAGVTDRLLRGPAAALLLAVALALTGCSGSGSSSPRSGTGTSGPPTSGPNQSQSQSAQSTPSIPSTPNSSLLVPQGVTVTPQGTSLSLGHAATVAWQPDQGAVAVIRLTVTRLERVPVSAFRDFRLDRATRRSTPYFVRARVTNLGRSDLGGVPVPLYLLDHQHTLLQASTFQAQFPACPSRPLPSTFRPGSHATVCLVYFVPKHGKLVAMSFRPSQDYDAITWHGHVRRSTGEH